MALEAENNGLTLKLRLAGEMPVMNGDRERLEQVVINILSNAVKYTPRGGHIELSAAPYDSTHVKIAVQDDGMGIPEADQPRLFERFYRVDKARSRAKGGSGLGLAIAKEMVEGPPRHHLAHLQAGRGHDLHHHPADQPCRPTQTVWYNAL